MNKTKRRLVGLLVVAIAAVAAGAWWLRGALSGFSGNEAVWVLIPYGASEWQVADSLRTALGDSFGGTVASLWNGDTKVSHGAYRIEPGERAWRVARKIGRGRQMPVRLTFNNLRTMRQLSELIGKRMEFSPEEFLAAADSLAVARAMVKRSEELPSMFVPDTYEAYWTDSPEKVVGMLFKYRDRFWNEDRRAKAEALRLTPVEVAVLASIVEEESNVADERPLIARLYINRLERGMPLQADPTVKFACGDFAARRVTGAMLRKESPYNTYRCAGLPPGPIRIPSKEAIDAVLDAPAHDWLYMCAKADFSGRHAFAADFAAHTRNAAAYRRALDARGIR